MAELKTLVDKVLFDNKDKFFTQEEIRDQIEKIKINEDGEHSYSYKSLQSTVSRRLSELQKEGFAIKIGREYAYKTTKNIHNIVKDEICSKVTFFKDSVFVMSSSVVVVPVNGTTVSIAKELFREYYGEDGFYDAIFSDGYLFLMLNTSAIDMDINEIAKDIEEIIKDAKQFENKRQEIRVQLQQTRVMREIMKYVQMPKLADEPNQLDKTTEWDELNDLYGGEELDKLDEFDEK